MLAHQILIIFDDSLNSKLKVHPTKSTNTERFFAISVDSKQSILHFSDGWLYFARLNTQRYIQ